MLRKFYMIICLTACIAISSACAPADETAVTTEQQVNQNLKLFEEELAQELTLSHEELSVVYEDAWELLTNNLSDEKLELLKVENGVDENTNRHILMSLSDGFQPYVAAALDIDVNILAAARANVLIGDEMPPPLEPDFMNPNPYIASGYSGFNMFFFNISSSTQISGMRGPSFSKPDCKPYVRVSPKGGASISVYWKTGRVHRVQMESGEVYTYCGRFNKIRVSSPSRYDIYSSHSITHS